MLARSFLIESSSKLRVTRTGIKAWSSLILGRIRPLILELLALEWRKFHTFELEYLWGQLASLDQILCVASLGWGKGCIRFWSRLTLAHWTQVSDRCFWATCFSILIISFGENGVGLYASRTFICLFCACMFLSFFSSSWCRGLVAVCDWIFLLTFSLCAQWVASYGPNLSSCGQQRLRSDWADAQADLSRRWAYMPFCWFCHDAAHLFSAGCLWLGLRQDVLKTRHTERAEANGCKKWYLMLNHIIKHYLIPKYW